MFPGAHLTTPITWTCTGILAVLDILLVLLAGRSINREHFQRMRWLLVGCGGAFFLVVWIIVLTWGWEWFYHYIFPDWARFVLPVILPAGYSLVALGMTWLSLKLPGKPAVTWCLLGGLEGLLSHIYAIFSLGAASKPPIMQGTDPYAVLVFAVFEKAFYWSLILLASASLSHIPWRNIRLYATNTRGG